MVAQNTKRMFIECAWETRDWEMSVEDVRGERAWVEELETVEAEDEEVRKLNQAEADASSSNNIVAEEQEGSSRDSPSHSSMTAVLEEQVVGDEQGQVGNSVFVVSESPEPIKNISEAKQRLLERFLLEEILQPGMWRHVHGERGRAGDEEEDRQGKDQEVSSSSAEVNDAAVTVVELPPVADISSRFSKRFGQRSSALDVRMLRPTGRDLLRFLKQGGIATFLDRLDVEGRAVVPLELRQELLMALKKVVYELLYKSQLEEEKDAARIFQTPGSARTGNTPSQSTSGGEQDSTPRFYLSHRRILDAYKRRLRERVTDPYNVNPPMCFWGYYIAATIRTRMLEPDPASALNRERDTLVKMIQRMLMDKANIGNVADLSGWPLDHAQMIRSVWPDSTWRILQPGGLPTDTTDTVRPIASSSQQGSGEDDSTLLPGTTYRGGSSGGGSRRILFRVPEDYYPERNVLRVSVVGYHATLALEIVKVWELLPEIVPGLNVRITTSIIDDELDRTLDGETERNKLSELVTNGQNFHLINKLVGGKLADGARGHFGTGADDVGDIGVDRKVDASSGSGSISSTNGDGGGAVQEEGGFGAGGANAQGVEDSTASSSSSSAQTTSNSKKAQSGGFRLCSYFNVCAKDSRLLHLNKRFLRRVTLPKTGLANPGFPEFEAWLNEWVFLFKSKDEDPKRADEESLLAELRERLDSVRGFSQAPNTGGSALCQLDEDADEDQTAAGEEVEGVESTSARERSRSNQHKHSASCGMSKSELTEQGGLHQVQDQPHFDLGIDTADIHVCTEPAVLCLPVAIANPRLAISETLWQHMFRHHIWKHGFAIFEICCPISFRLLVPGFWRSKWNTKPVGLSVASARWLCTSILCGHRRLWAVCPTGTFCRATRTFRLTGMKTEKGMPRAETRNKIMTLFLMRAVTQLRPGSDRTFVCSYVQ
ncbi:unnamed protein product [Amoebophrya sp. A25]|nr:unnamed protein product [Amoebophrya sp. A25]|eukprot:GSA25T00022769001.1